MKLLNIVKKANFCKPFIKNKSRPNDLAKRRTLIRIRLDTEFAEVIEHFLTFPREILSITIGKTHT